MKPHELSAAQSLFLPKLLDRVKSYKILISVALAMSISFLFITPYMMVASLAYFLMLVGLSLRKARPYVHARLMGAAIVLDLTLVLVLELQRHAIETVLSFKLGYLQQAHIAFSSGATLLYFPIVILGLLKFSQMRDRPFVQKYHKIFGITAFVLRTFGYLFMFSMLFKGT